MIRSLRQLLLAALVAAPGPALAQSTLLQGGSWNSGHVPMYIGQGTSGQVVVQDSGGAAGGGPGIGLSELNITARGTGTAPYAGQGTGPNGEIYCLNDAPTTNVTGYHALCLSSNAQGGGLLSYQAIGAATALPLQWIVNGTTYPFPFSTGGIVGPGVTVVNDAVCWNNLVGTLVKDCGAFVTVGGNNTWTGTNNFTGTFQIGGVTQTFPASGNLVGTSDSQTLTNKSIGASQINSGVLVGTVMPAYTGDVTSPSGSTVNTIAANAVTNAKLATATQNTVKGAATSTAAADLAVPSCSSAGNALQWTTNTGFSCGTLTNQTAGWGLTGSSTFSVSTSAPPFAFDYPINMALTASVGASALTINVVAADTGATPSATHPVLIPFRSGTLATGTVTWTAITGALTIIVPSAATLGTSNNVPFRLWLFATYNAGVPQLGVATCSLASTPTIYPCTSWEITRKTSITIDGFATSAGTLYATAGVSSDPVRIIGFADYASGLATAGAYASTPTTLQVMSPSISRPGQPVQTLYTSTTTSGTVTNTAFTALTNSPSLAITPTAAINLVKIRWAGTGLTTSTVASSIRLVRSSTQVGVPMIYGGAGAGITDFPVSQEAIDAPQTTSSTTYSFQGKAPSGAVTFPDANSGTTISIDELMGFDTSAPANDNIHPGAFSATG